MTYNVILGEVADIIMGQSPPGETCNNIGTGIPLLNGPTEFGIRYPKPVQFTISPTKLAEPGDILFCVRGSTTGRMNYADQPYAIGRGLAAIRGKNGYKTPYIKALLEQLLPDLLIEATGSTFPNVNRNQLLSRKVTVLPITEANEISAFLEAIEEKGELNRQVCTTLEEMARTIFRSWFVDFDPVRAKIAAKSAGRDPERAAMSALSGKTDEELDSLPAEILSPLAAIAALFPSSASNVDADIVPDGWTLGQFAEIAQYVRSTVIPRQVNPDEPYIGLEHMPRRSIALYEWGKASDVISQKSRFTSGQILFGKLRPYFHKVGIAPTDGVCSTDILVLEASAPHWYGYTVMVASSISMIEHVTSLSDGTKMPRTKWEDVARFPIVLPHADVAEAFSMILSPILEYIKTAIFESKHLIEARDTLLPKLLAGELQLTS